MKRELVGAAVRIRVMKRDRFQCTYCGVPGTDAELEVDHVIPVSKGGSNHMSNLTTACRTCNQRKGANLMTPNRQGIDGLIGKPIHLLQDGEIHRQGVLIDKVNGYFMVQLFSFLDGRETEVIPVTAEVILDRKQCRIYGSFEELYRAYAVDLQKAGLLRRTVEESVAWNMEHHGL